MFQAFNILVFKKTILFKTVTIIVITGRLLITKTIIIIIKVMVVGRTLDSVIIIRAIRVSLEN